MHLIFTITPPEAGVIILVLQRSALRPREVKRLAQAVWLVAELALRAWCV